MKRLLLSISAVALLIAPLAMHGDASASVVSKYQTKSYRDGGVVLRMSGAKGSVLSPGEEISFSYQTSDDAMVVLFNIDTEGYVHLLHPYDGAPTMARARETYRVPSGSDKLLVSGETGMEFVFAVTIPDRSALDDDELSYLREIENRPREERYRIDGDPFLAANIIAGELVRGISHRDGVFLDYTYFYVNQRVDHPCYLCGECDGGSPALCDDFDLVADLDRASPMTYPLRRAYETYDRSAPAAGDDIEVAYDRDTAVPEEDVNISFYPYSAEVRYVTQPRTYAYVDYYDDPFWYDPWYCGYVYYPTWRYPYYGHYYSWSFSWNYWGGYYCSSWYYPRYRNHWDYYHHNYWDYANGYGRTAYKSAYKQRSSTAYKDGSSSLVASRKQLSKRNSSLQIASKNLKRTTATTRVAKRGTATRTGKSSVRTTRVTTRGGKSITRSRTSTRTRAQAPSRVKSGTRSRSGSNRATVKSRSGSSSRKGSAVKRGGSKTPRVKSRAKSGSSRSKSSVKSKRSSSSSRSKSSVKCSRSRSGSSVKSSWVKRSSSSRSKSSAKSSSSRSSGKSRSKKSRRK